MENKRYNILAIFIAIILGTLVLLPSIASGAPNKYLIVDLSDQKIYLIQNDVVVWSRLVATGKDGFETPTGTHKITWKSPLRTMRGSANGESWVVPNVRHILYFTDGGHAIHAAHWHNLFGVARLSHGCVNLRPKDAEWLYGRIPVGTTVIIRK